MTKKPSERKAIPKEVFVSAELFKVKICTLDGMHGDCDVPNREIRISKDIDYDTQVRTLFHELGHACIGVGGLSHLFTDPQEEAICDVLELLRHCLEFK